MDANGPFGRFSPFILRACFALVFVGLLCWHVSVHTSTSRTGPAKPDTQVPSGFSTPRTLYSGKRIIDFDWNLVHGLAHERITQLEREVYRDFWENSDLPDGSIAAGCSTLYPSHSPASSCWRYGGLQEEQSMRLHDPKKPVQVKVSFLEVPRGETATSAMAKRMQQAIDQATIDAQTEAISKGLSGTQAQHYAEEHRQQLLQSNPQDLAAQHLPTFDLENLDLQSLFPEMLGGSENGERLAALSGMMRALIQQLEATIADLDDDADEYEEPSLEESLADDLTINQTYSDIQDMLPVNLYGQPACPLVPRLAPIPLSILETPWLPVLKQLFSEFGRVDSDGSSTDSTSLGRTRTGHTAVESENAPGMQARDEMHSSSSGSVASADTTSAATEQDVGDAWAAGNAAQRHIEATLKTERMPPPPDAQNYSKQRLQQVSDMTRRVDDEYYNLFLQRARAKHLQFEVERSITNATFHEASFVPQLENMHAMTRFAMGPVSDEHVAMDHLWRDLVHIATLRTRVVACMSAGGHEGQCHNQAAVGARPPVYAPFEELGSSQKEEFRALLEGIFTNSVRQPPVRLPVLHWDSRVDSTMSGQIINLNGRAAGEELAASLWAKGRGEPRQDAWQVMEAVAGRHTDEREDVVQAVQAQTVQRYLNFQIEQMLIHIEEWSALMEPKEIRKLVLKSRHMRRRDELYGMHPGDADKAGSRPTSEELLQQLRTKLSTRPEEGVQDEG